MRENKNGLYVVRYKYTSPGPGGPYKGFIVTDEKKIKRDLIYAAFGEAEVTSCMKNKNRKETD